jgi:uncharacterized protein VirK/YbjX
MIFSTVQICFYIEVKKIIIIFSFTTHKSNSVIIAIIISTSSNQTQNIIKNLTTQRKNIHKSIKIVFT